jgi:hypothetical protein
MGQRRRGVHRAAMMQLLILPYLRGALHIPRRDLVLASSDSLTLRVTVVESDDPSAQALELSGGVGGPMVHMRVWAHDAARPWDYGWRPIPGLDRLFWSSDAVVSDAIGSFDIFIPRGVMAGWPQRCGWSIQLNFDNSGADTTTAPSEFDSEFNSEFTSGSVVMPPSEPILVGGFQQSEMLAMGMLHVRWAGNRRSTTFPLFTDDSTPILTDSDAGSFVFGTSDFGDGTF